MVDAVYAQGNDWMGIYIDGKLIEEGHSISALAAMEICIKHRPDQVTWREVDERWLNDQGNLPERLHDVKWGK